MSTSSFRYASYVVIDVETTGLDPLTNGLVSISARDSRGCEFHMKVQPFVGSVWTKEAEKVHGITEEQANTEFSEWLCLSLFSEWLKSAPLGWLFVGANPSFDYDFLMAAAKRTGIDLGLDYHKVDVQSIAIGMYYAGRIMLPLSESTGQPKMTLNAVLAAVGLKRVGDTHDSMEDVRLTESALLRLVA